MKKIYILPNLFTAASLFCGVMALFEVFDRSDPSTAIYFILASSVIDVLDGFIARLTRSQSTFGVYFDSLADVVAFGVAPAVIVYPIISEEFSLLAKATCGLYVVCGALRLARFNVQATREEKKSFLGLPIPGAACAGLSLFWVLNNHPSTLEMFAPEKVLPVVMVLLAYLMVSQFPYYGFKSLRIPKDQPFEILVIIVVIISMLVALHQHFDLIVFGLFGPYALSGPVIYFYQKLSKLSPARMQAARAAGGPKGHTAAKSSGDLIDPDRPAAPDTRSRNRNQG